MGGKNYVDWRRGVREELGSGNRLDAELETLARVQRGLARQGFESLLETFQVNRDGSRRVAPEGVRGPLSHSGWHARVMVPYALFDEPSMATLRAAAESAGCRLEWDRELGAVFRVPAQSPGADS